MIVSRREADSASWGSGTTTLDYVVPPITALQQRIAAQGNKTVLAQSLSNDIDPGVAAATGKTAALVLCVACVRALCPKRRYSLSLRDSGEGGIGLTQVDGNWGDRSVPT